MPIIKLSNGKTFQADIDVSILNAAERVGINLPYSCKSGRCSECKCRLIDGTTALIADEIGLTEYERSEGWILSCVRTAKSDLVIETNDAGLISLPTIKNYPCKISAIERLTPDVLCIILRLPPTVVFNYFCGQYVEVSNFDGVRRSYSIANAKLNNLNQLEIHVRRVKGGRMSQYWFENAAVDDLLSLKGPLGTFYLRNTEKRDIFFLATGTGIAPIKAMIESLKNQKQTHRPSSVIAIWGSRTQQDIYLNTKLLQGECQFLTVLSQPLENWTGPKGYVQDQMLPLIRDIKNTSVYACGSPLMINSAKSKLYEIGLPLDQFFSDAFFAS